MALSDTINLHDLSVCDDHVKAREKKYLATDEWDNTLRLLDQTCLTLRKLVEADPGNIELVEKWLNANEKLVQATKMAEEHRHKIKMDRDELNFEDQRRQSIWNASDRYWGSPERLEAAKAFTVYHRK